MKFKIEQKTLARALTLASSFCEKKSTIPILGNGLMSVSDCGTLTICATNMEHQIKVTEECVDVEDASGVSTFPMALTLGAVKKISKGAIIEIEAGDEEITIRSGRYFTTLRTLPDEDYPALVFASGGQSFSVGSKDLLAQIRSVEFAISTEETRYYLNGIYMHRHKNGFRFVATDGHRLALSYLGDVGVSGEGPEKGIIIPRQFVGIISGLLNHDGEVEVSFNDARISMSFPGVTVSSKLIDGSFPEYERVIPRGNDRVAIIDNEEFSAMVDRVAAVSDERSRPVKLSFSKELLCVSYQDKEGNRADDELDIQSDFKLEIGFQARYVLDVLHALNRQPCEWKFADSSAPAVIVPVNNRNSVFVIMPMRV